MAVFGLRSPRLYQNVYGTPPPPFILLVNLEAISTPHTTIILAINPGISRPHNTSKNFNTEGPEFNTAGKAFILHAIDWDLILDIPYGLLSTAQSNS